MHNKQEYGDGASDGIGENLDRRDLLKLLAGLGLGLGVAASAGVQAQDAARVNPRSYKVVFENEKIRVLEYTSKPGLGICGQGKHYHPAHATVQLTDATVKLTTAQGKQVTVEAKAGTVFGSPAEWHVTENVGGNEAHAYIIEFKDGSWKPSTG
jgi:beta-alanine degradation protein BauB